VARTVRWTETATQDLAEAAAFIGRDSRFYAAALVRETRAAAQSLRTFAERGRVVPEIDAPDIRELFIRSYRLLYQVTADRVFVLGLCTALVISRRCGNVAAGHGRRAPNA
jgi:toxin ParE1/3/4